MRARTLALLLALAGPVAEAQIAVVGTTVHERAIAPGAEARGTIEVRNTASAPVAVRAYLTDYHFESAGRSYFPEPGTLPRSSGAWTTLPVTQATIPPGRTVALPYAVRAPDDSTLAGTYWTAVMVEAIAPPADGATIRTVVRYGVQLVQHVGAAATPDLAASDVAIERDSTGNAVVRLGLRNAGTRGVAPDVAVELYDANGRQVDRGQVAGAMLYPGSSYRLRAPVGVHPAGRYVALVVVDAGGDAVQATAFDVTF